MIVISCDCFFSRFLGASGAPAELQRSSSGAPAEHQRSSSWAGAPLELPRELQLSTSWASVGFCGDDKRSRSQPNGMLSLRASISRGHDIFFDIGVFLGAFRRARRGDPVWSSRGSSSGSSSGAPAEHQPSWSSAGAPDAPKNLEKKQSQEMTIMRKNFS